MDKIINVKKNNNNDAIEDTDVLAKNNVFVREEVLRNYPLIDLREIDLQINKPMAFSRVVTYKKPKGVSSKALAIIELLNPDGEFFQEKIEFEFAYSELERIEDAKSPSSFKIRPEIFYLNNFMEMQKSDVIPKYSDVEVLEVKSISDHSQATRIEILFAFKEENVDISNAKIYSVVLNFNHKNHSIVDVMHSDDTLQIEVLKSLNLDRKSLTIDVNNVKHYKINREFLLGTPPQEISNNIIKPFDYIVLKKVDYLPPKDVNSVEAILIVEYEFDNKIFVENVLFRFGGSIRNDVEKQLLLEPKYNFVYLPILRRTPPSKIETKDFIYKGDLDLEIAEVKYDYDLIHADYRFVDVELVVVYRTVVTSVKKRIEFKYSKSEYLKNQSLDSQVIENNSIFIPKSFTSSDFIYSNLTEGFDFVGQREIMRNASIADDFPYSEIKGFEFVNFHPEKREVIFRITVVEIVGKTNVERSFNKVIDMDWSYEEWKLGKTKSEDLKVDYSKLREYPSKGDIKANIFLPNDLFQILEIEYDFPSDETSKKILLNVILAKGGRVRSIEYELNYNKSYAEHRRYVEDSNIIGALVSLKPSDISLVLDVNDRAPEIITSDQILGIPEGVEVDVKYSPPAHGKKSTRVLIEFKKNNFVVGFEQTLIFAKES